MLFPEITAITATCGRHTLLERSIRFFIDQDYNGKHNLLIYNNSDVKQELVLPADLRANKSIYLINNHIDPQTGVRFSNLGAIYNDAIRYVPPTTELVTFSDDDDGYLPNHFTEGAKGYEKAKSINLTYKAYKPNTSFYKHSGGVIVTGNRMEPSIFVEYQHVFNKGFTLTTTCQHMGWLGELELEGTIFIDPEGPPTLVYDWGTPIPTFKTSGNPGAPENFENYRISSVDHGDGRITPVSEETAQEYYDLVRSAIK